MTNLSLAPVGVAIAGEVLALGRDLLGAEAKTFLSAAMRIVEGGADEQLRLIARFVALQGAPALCNAAAEAAMSRHCAKLLRSSLAASAVRKRVGPQAVARLDGDLPFWAPVLAIVATSLSGPDATAALSAVSRATVQAQDDPLEDLIDCAAGLVGRVPGPAAFSYLAQARRKGASCLELVAKLLEHWQSADQRARAAGGVGAEEYAGLAAGVVERYLADAAATESLARALKAALAARLVEKPALVLERATSGIRAQGQDVEHHMTIAVCVWRTADPRAVRPLARELVCALGSVRRFADSARQLIVEVWDTSCQSGPLTRALERMALVPGCELTFVLDRVIELAVADDCPGEVVEAVHDFLSRCFGERAVERLGVRQATAVKARKCLQVLNAVEAEAGQSAPVTPKRSCRDQPVRRS